MYEIIDTIGTVSIIFVAVGICLGVPCFIMEKLQEKTGFLNPFFRFLYGKDWDQAEDFEDEPDYDEWAEYTDYDTSR